jgi:DNA-binding NarL/FixJ family response regulator
MQNTVLLIDDDVDAEELVRVALEELEHELIGFCEYGDLAIQTCRSLSPELVILDFCLPDRDGLKVLQDIRNAGMTVPVLMYSNLHDDQSVVAALRSGANGFLLKSSPLSTLRRAVIEIKAGCEFWIDNQISNSLLERCRLSLSSS